MKKLCALLGCFLLIFAFLTAACTVSAEDVAAPVESNGKNTSAAKALALTEVGVTDALNKESAQRWYTVDVTVAGDAVVLFYADFGRTTVDICWACTFIAADKTTVLATADMGYGQSFMAVNDLTVGTYYLRVQAATETEESDPKKTYGYTDGAFTLDIVTCATSVAVDPETHIVDKVGDLLCVVDGHLFVKAADGEAVAGAYVNEDGEAGPLLMWDMVGKNCDYFSSATGSVYKSDHHSDYVHFEGESNSWKVSSDYGLVAGGTVAAAEGLYVCYEGEAVNLERAARQLINVYRGVDPMEGLAWDNFMASPAAPWVFGGIAVAVIVIIVVAHFISTHSWEAERWRLVRGDDADSPTVASNTPASNSDDDDPLPWTANHDNAKDM